MAKKTPIEEVINMSKQGMSDPQIIGKLTEQGFNPVQIHDSLNQARIKQEIEMSETKPLPSQLGFQPSAIPQQPMPQLPPQLPPKNALPPLPPLPGQVETPVPKPSVIPPMPPQPQPQPIPQQPQMQAPEGAYPYTYPSYDEEAIAPKINTEAIEEIAEEIVNEKWQEVKSKIADVIEWKTYAEKRITSVDDRIKRLESSLDKLQAALLAKMNEYGHGVKGLGAEMTSLENTLGKILPSLVGNVKELGKITDELKAKSKKKQK
ncbi:hypothetical protein ACFLZZ_02065 [Nanoarchaeota archaeon]